MKKKIISTLSILALSTSVLVACNSDSAKKVGTSPDGSEIVIEQATMKFIEATKEGDYKLVSTEDLNEWIKSDKDMIIIDTMPADKYSEKHIPGAINAELPNGSVEEATAEEREAFVKLLGDDKSKTIVTYCGFVGCARSDVGAAIAREEGFTEVYRHPGGIVAWDELGYDIEKAE